MKYLVLKDLSICLKNYKVLLIYFLTPIIYLLFLIKALDFNNVSTNIIYSTLSINHNFKDVFSLLLFVINISILYYLELSIFNNDFNINKQFIFLRIKTNNWIKYRLISFTTISFALSFFKIISIILLLLLLKIDYTMNIYCFLKCFIIENVRLLSLFLLYCLYGNNSVFCILLINILIIFICSTNEFLIQYECIEFLFLILILLFILFFCMLKIFEKIVIHRRIYD